MKHPFLVSIAKKISLICLISTCYCSMVEAEPPTSAFGVWDRGETKDPHEYPFLKGTSCDAPWDSVEKQPGVYDWSVMDQAVESAYRNKISIYFSFEAGPKTPDWVYQKGVPKDRQERIAFIQVKTGCTGDETPYKGRARDSKYDLPKSSPEWLAFRLETFALYAKLFDQGPDPKISLLFNGIAGNDENGEEGKNPEEWKWVTCHITGSIGAKVGALSRGHHLSGERSTVATWHRYLIDPKGLTIFGRSEMDQTWRKQWYQLNVPLNFYWAALNALNNGQSVWDVSKSAIKASKKQGFDYSFYFFNRYAGQIYPKTATDAFCALHKGLDAADTEAYPEAKFGQASKGNVDRMLKICSEFSKYGASVDDKAALTLGQVAQRDSQKGFNDVGWDIWPDNYSRFLYQIDADQTSIPLWRVGGPITKTSSIYSRFARGFEHASGKEAMYFKLHNGFSQDAKPKVMSITVVWYDGQEGSTWKLDYDAGASTMTTALSVTGKGDKQWHHEVVTLNDAVLYHGGTKGSDIALINTDNKDDIISIIEVHRGVPEVVPASTKPASDR